MADTDKTKKKIEKPEEQVTKGKAEVAGKKDKKAKKSKKGKKQKA